MKKYIREDIKESIQVKTNLLESKDIIESIELAANNCIKALNNNNKILLAGNGGSAADAQHIAAEFIGRFEKNRAALGAIALTTDTSVLTAISNDYDFDTIFSRQIEGLGNMGDILIAISTSGNSNNIIKAAKVAKKMKLFVIGLTGSSGGNLKGHVDLLINIPSTNTARIQESHILVGHLLCSITEKYLFN